MTPERRKELRRCDEACFRTRTGRQIEEKDKRIKELESTVITDNTETMANALERIKALESLLARSGDCMWTFREITRDRVDFKVSLGNELESLISEIDAILPATEGNKDGN